MKCAAHPESDASGYCSQCGKAMCEGCTRDVRGVLFCEECLAARVAAPPAATLGAPSPGAALALGLIPGVGAIYNGEYLKGLIQIVVFFGLASMIDAAPHFVQPMFGFLMVGFYFYMVIDSYQTAKRRAAGLAPAPSGWSFSGEGARSQATPVGPLILIILGVLFLGSTMGIFAFEYFRFMWRLWPLILIAVGAWMLWKRSTGGAPPGAPPPPNAPPKEGAQP